MKNRWLFILLASCACYAGQAAATLTTFAFTGQVTDDPFGLSSFGAPISGTYSFDSSATDAISGASTGSFASAGPGYGFRVNVDGTAYSVLGSLTVTTANDIGSGVDQYGAIASDSALSLEIFLEDASGAALASDAMPLVPPALVDFDFRQFRLFGMDVEFLGSIDTLVCTSGCSVQSVPEPGSLALTLLTLGLLGLLRLLGRARADTTKRQVRV